MPASTPFRIGFLVDNLTSEYPAELAMGVLRAARQMQASAVIITGGELGVLPAHPVVRNFVYDWLPSARLDGLVISAGSLSNHCGNEYFRQWLVGLGTIPLVAIGLDLGDVPSVHVDNESGMYELVSHLIEVHGRRRIAFIGGPETSAEGQARLRGYERALRGHDIRIDERLLLKAPHLGREDGMAAVTELFEARRVSPETLDAIVSMNDEMALGVIEALNRRGISVPKRIAVAGFDDSADASTANPPLSTVNQHIELQAYTATRALLEALASGTRPRGVQLKSAAVIRASCGCVQPLSNASSLLPAPNLKVAKTAKLALLERRGIILAELARAANGRLGGLPQWESRLLDALLQDLTVEPVTFLREIEQLVRQHVSRGHNTAGFHDVLTALRLQVLTCASLEPESRPKIEDLFQESRLTVSRIGSEVERSRYQNSSMHLRILWRACLAQLENASVDGLASLLEQHVPGLGVASFCVSRLREGAPPGRELEVLWRRSARGASRPSQTLSLAELGIDSALEAEPALIVKPLEFNNRPVGLAVFTWGALELPHYAQLRDMLGPALFGAGNRRDGRTA